MRVLWITFLVLVLDQITKVLVKTNMYLGQTIPVVGDWFRLTFTENAGMAFGLTLGVPLLVTALSIAATIAIVFYLWHARTMKLGYRLSLAFVLGGAFGNIVDRVLYGWIFDYAPLLQGRVVDFVHVNVFSGRAADWIPFLGGKHVTLFPIWNVADMAIVCGVIAIIALHGAIEERLAEDARMAEEKMPATARVPVPPASIDTPHASGNAVIDENKTTAE